MTDWKATSPVYRQEKWKRLHETFLAEFVGNLYHEADLARYFQTQYEETPASRYDEQLQTYLRNNPNGTVTDYERLRRSAEPLRTR